MIIGQLVRKNLHALIFGSHIWADTQESASNKDGKGAKCNKNPSAFAEANLSGHSQQNPRSGHFLL